MHEKTAACSDYVIERENQRQFHRGPVGIPGGPATIAIEVLMNMGRVLTIATRIVQQEDIIRRADQILEKVDTLRAAQISRPRQPTV